MPLLPTAGALAGVINFTTTDASDFLRDGDKLAVRLKGATETNAQGHTLSGIVATEPVDGVELLPENPDFQPIVVGPGDAFALEGIAVGLIRNTMLM